MRYSNRYQFGLTLLTGFFLLATFIAVLLYSVTPATPSTKGPLLLTAFVAILLGTLICILFFLRWVFRPYRQLVGEAQKAQVESRAPKSKDEAEFVLETFQSVVAQLQEQRQALEQLSKQASKRADSAERFSERIVASVPSALIAFDGAGRSMVMNAPGYALLGVDGGALGQPVDEILHNVPQLAEMVTDCLRTGMVYRREEIEMLAAEQSPRRLGATVAPIDLMSEQSARGVLCLLTDITEVTQLREQVALKKNLENLGEMSAGLAHEFKNAIATLHGYVQLLQSLGLDEDARGTAASLLNEVRNLSDMVTSFLNFARPQPLNLDDVNLDELMAECAAELAPLFKQAAIELIITTDTITAAANEHAASGTAAPGIAAPGSAGILPALPTPAASNKPAILIRADERMLRQALLNLIRNAAESIPPSQPNRRVEISSSIDQPDRKSCVTIEIRDTGEGIPAADLQRIFIPFFTTKATGHGVGLALAHRVITQHGGTLTAANAKDGGAVFSVRLPL
jgi:two-component system sensor histidine kinase PilS (NtrC family)